MKDQEDEDFQTKMTSKQKSMKRENIVLGTIAVITSYGLTEIMTVT